MSSTFWYPIICDKPIIILKDFTLPKIWNIRAKEYIKLFNFVNFDINGNLNNKKLNTLYINSQKKIIDYKKIKNKYLGFSNKLASTVLLNLN